MAQFDAIFMMKTRYKDRKRSIKLLTKILTVVTSVWGPGWLLLSSISLLAFSEVAIINMNSRFTLEKVNVILHAILPMELLWIWVWASTLFLMLPRVPPWGRPDWQKFQENKPKMQFKEICSGRGAKCSIQSLASHGPWKNKEATLSERKDLALWWENVDRGSRVGCGGGLTQTESGAGLYLPIISRPHPELQHSIILLAINYQHFLHPM